MLKRRGLLTRLKRGYLRLFQHKKDDIKYLGLAMNNMTENAFKTFKGIIKDSITQYLRGGMTTQQLYPKHPINVQTKEHRHWLIPQVNTGHQKYIQDWLLATP